MVVIKDEGTKVIMSFWGKGLNAKRRNDVTSVLGKVKSNLDVTSFLFKVMDWTFVRRCDF